MSIPDYSGKAWQVGLIAMLAVSTWIVSVKINNYFYQRGQIGVRVSQKLKRTSLNSIELGQNLFLK